MKQRYLLIQLLSGFLLSYVATLFSVSAQDFVQRDKPMQPTPDGRSGGIVNVGGVPVNLFTGTASPNIPIYELPSRSLSVPVSLVYTAGNGVQVTSVASEVGTGWELAAGGSVTCEVKGRPDELDQENNPKAWLDAFYSRLSWQANGWYMEQAQRKVCEGRDTERDIYHLSAPGLQADFVINGPYGGGVMPQFEVKVLNDPTLSVVPRYRPYNGGYYYDIYSFTVTNAQGTVYFFDQRQQTRVETETRLTRTGVTSSKDDYTYYSQWHLTSITNTQADQVNFGYEMVSSASAASYKSFAHVTLAYQFCDAWEQFCDPFTPSANSYFDNRYETTTTVTQLYPYRISNIYSEVGTIRFTRSQSSRRDAPGEKTLDKITVSDREGHLISGHSFTYGYFGPSGTTSSSDVRLRLDKVTHQTGGCRATSTRLQYWESGTVSRTTAERDYWGYFNSNPSGELLPFVESRYASGNRSAGPLSRSKNCLLTQIQQSTGAYTELVYGSQKDNLGADVGGVRIQRVRLHNGVDAALDQFFDLSYTVFNPANPNATNSNSSACAVKTPLLYDWQKLRYSTSTPPSAGYRYGMTLQICDTNDDKIEKFLYRSSDPIEPIAPDYVHYQWVTVKYPNLSRSAFLFTTSQLFADTYNNASAKMSTNPYNRNNSNNCYVSSGGLPTQYGGSCSGDPMSPRHAGDYRDLPQNERPYGILNSAAAKRGLLLQKVDVDAANRMVGSVLNEYDFTQTDPLPFKSAVVDKERMVFGYTAWSYYYNAKVYQHEQNWTPLTQTTATVYDQRRGNTGTIAAHQQVTEYEYRNKYVSKIKTYTPSAGEANVVEYNRAVDGHGPPILRTSGCLATVVGQHEYQLVTSSGATKNDYYTYWDYDFTGKPFAARKGTYNAIPSGGNPANVWEYGINALAFDQYNNVVNTQAKSGMSNGTLWGYHALMPIAQVTNGTFSINEFNGQISATAGHTSFEEYNPVDGWLPTQFEDYEAKTGTRSGRFERAISEFGSERKFRLTPANQHGKYVFSCWAKLPQAQTAATEFVMVAVLKRGNSTQDQLQWFGNTATVSSNQQWGRYQVEVNLDNAAVKNLIPANEDAVIQCYLWLTGNNPVLVDEIRFCASQARMTTATYRPLVGKTSSTDENQVTTYYEYDADNNPTLVRDDRGNILKRTKHNIAAETRDLTLVVQRSSSNLYSGQPITFTASVPECLNGVRHYWNFGDVSGLNNTAKDVASAVHTFAAPGTYVVTATADAPSMNSIEQTITIQIISRMIVDLNINGELSYDNCNPPSQTTTILTTAIQSGCGGFTYRWESQGYSANGTIIRAWTAVGMNADTLEQDLQSLDAPQVGVRCIVTDSCGNQETTDEVVFRIVQNASPCQI